MDYNATITLTVSKTGEAEANALMDALIDYHPAIGTGRAGRTEAVITYPADSLRQAVSTAFALAAVAGIDAAGIEVLPTEMWDQREDSAEVPPLLSVSEAAEILGVSRQAVGQRLDAGTLIGTRVGKVWVIPRGNLG